MTVASFIVSQRTEHGVPHVLSCRALDVASSTLQVAGPPADSPPGTPGLAGRGGKGVLRRLGRDARHLRVAQGVEGPLRGRMAGVGEHRRRLDGPSGPCRSVPEAQASLPDPSRQGRCADTRPSGPGLQRQGHQPALVRGPDRDPHRRGQAVPGHRRGPGVATLPGFAIGEHHDAALARAALRMAAAVRGGKVAGVIFHTDKGGETGLKESSQRCCVRQTVEGR